MTTTVAPRPGTHRWDLMMYFDAGPRAADVTGTALRLLHAALRRGGRVQTWACGAATLLTARPAGPAAPCPSGCDHPGAGCPGTETSVLVGELLRTYGGQLRWCACRLCSDGNGVVHIDGVRLVSPLRMPAAATAARKTLYVGPSCGGPPAQLLRTH